MKRLWLIYALVTTLSWGVWGAFIEIPEKAGFPATLGFSVWALTMVPCAIVALWIIRWKLDRDLKSIMNGMAVGLLGGGGQLILFEALRQGPAYIVFPLISLYPIITIALSMGFLKEKANLRQGAGIFLALAAIFFLSWQKPGESPVKGYSWLIMSVLVFMMWGIQSFVMKSANLKMKAESIFFYMALSGVLLIPFAIWMTDFSVSINWGLKGPWLAASIHILNSIGALTLVYAVRYGKAIVVFPLTGLSPVITVILSLVVYAVIPGAMLTTGLILATIAILLLSE